MPTQILDLSLNRTERNNRLVALIHNRIEDGQFSLDHVLHTLIEAVLGNTIIDDELEENIAISIAHAFDIKTKKVEK